VDKPQDPLNKNGPEGASNGGAAGSKPPADAVVGHKITAPGRAPADGVAAGGDADAEGVAGKVGAASGVDPQVIDLTAVKPVQVVDLAAASSVPVAALNTPASMMGPPSMLIGQKLTRSMLYILAGSIFLLLFYLGWMERTAGDDIRHNYGKDLNRGDIALYMAQRIQRFSDDLTQAQKDSRFAASEDSISDDKALRDTLGLLPDVTSEDRTQLTQCVELIATKETTGSDRANKIKPCVEILEKTKNDGMKAATAAMSLQMASEASAKLLEERQNLHEFWLKAAQLILLNLLLPVLTAVIGYTFGNNQAQQQQPPDSQ
jgi:hypothetical protein